MIDPEIDIEESGAPDDVVSFTAMVDGTAADYALLDRHERRHAAGLADRIEHSLQSATRARNDGASIDWVVAALVHDIGDDLAPYNHSELAAAILQPYVAEEVHWVVRHHGVFQSYYFAHHLGGDRHARDRFRDHRWFDLCAEFCERWDQPSFDPTFPTEPLASFEDDLRAVVGRDAWDPAMVGVGSERLV
jgi:predicted HD phosphohydrolase